MHSRLASYVASLDDAQALDVELEQIVEAAAARRQAGEPLDIEQLIASHPGYADQLRELLPAVEMLIQIGETPPEVEVSSAATNGHAPPPPHEQLGDFRIIRELGRGGMGTVFEAEQLSMGRRVALKVLPFAALAHDKSLQRFRNEVRAAAALDHPHIVAIYSVGEERGVHFYAMQLIRGQTLADLIRELRRNRLPVSPQVVTGASNDAPKFDSATSSPPSTRRNAQGHVSTAADSRRSAEFYRSAARLGIQAAEALQHAHDLGVLHRDIKPGNLMLDGEAKLYVTDFGLARIEADAGLTMTGDIIGTLRYMAPEQALAKRVVIDHRADVYSLGATMYELLTLQPAFSETDRSELLKQIAFEEPRPLRKFDRHIPVELETIVLTAMAKSLDERYQSAQWLSDDLRAYLEHRPIKAKPPTLLNRAAKWSRRHVGVVWTLLAASVVATVILATSAVLIAQSRNDADTQRLIATREKDTAIDERRLAVDDRNKAELNQYCAEIVSGQADLEQGNIARLDQKLIHHLPLSGAADRRRWEWYYLFSHCHPEQRALHYPTYALFADWSPDGEHIGAGGAIWNVKSGECIHLYGPSLSSVDDCAWSPDSQEFAWGALSTDSAIYIWNRQSDTVRELRGHKQSVWCLAFSPDGRQLASGSIDGTTKIWDRATGALLHTFNVGNMVSSVAWSPDGELLAAGVCHGKGLLIWSVATGESVATRPEPNTDRIRLSWNPDGKRLAVNTSTHWYILDRSDWTPVLDHKHRFGGLGNSDGVDIEWNPAGTALAYSDGSIVTIWDPATDKELARLAGHIEPVNSVAWSPDGRQLLTADRTSEIKVWALDSPLQPPTVNTGAGLQQVAWEPNCDTLVSVAASDLTISYWSASTGKPVKVSNHPAVDGADAGKLSPDRRMIGYLSSVDGKRAITVRDALTGATQSVWRPEESFEPVAFNWSPDGSKLAISVASDTNSGLECWDVKEERTISRWIRRKRIAPYGVVADDVPSLLTWSLDGARIAVVGTGDSDKEDSEWLSRVHVIDAVSGKRILKRAIGQKSNDGGAITALAWSPNSRLLAMANREGAVNVTDVDVGKLVWDCATQDSAIGALAWSPDGERLASAAAAGPIKVIEARRGIELLTLRMAERSATHLAWSPDGQRLAGASEDGVIQIWDASHGYAFADGGNRQADLAWDYYRLTRDGGDPSVGSALQKTIELAPKTLDYRLLRGKALARLDRYDEAAMEFAASMPRQINLGFVPAYARMYACLGARDLDAYRQLRVTLLDAFRDSQDSSACSKVAWYGALVPNAIDGFEERVKSKSNASGDGDLFLGAMQYRLGRYGDSAETLTSLSARLEDATTKQERHDLALTQYFLAMARHQLGHEMQARRYFDAASASHEQFKDDPSVDWIGLVELNTLRREAGRMIEK